MSVPKQKKRTLSEWQSKLDGVSTENILLGPEYIKEEYGGYYTINQPLSELGLQSVDGTIRRIQTQAEIKGDFVALLAATPVSHIHTVPAGKYHIIKTIHAMNTTRTVIWRLYLSTDAGATWDQILQTFTDTELPHKYGDYFHYLEWRLNAGTKLKIYGVGGLAADFCSYSIIYEEYNE